MPNRLCGVVFRFCLDCNFCGVPGAEKLEQIFKDPYSAQNPDRRLFYVWSPGTRDATSRGAISNHARVHVGPKSRTFTCVHVPTFSIFGSYSELQQSKI
jgi:hypothetical protein